MIASQLFAFRMPTSSVSSTPFTSSSSSGSSSSSSTSSSSTNKEGSPVTLTTVNTLITSGGSKRKGKFIQENVQAIEKRLKTLQKKDSEQYITQRSGRIIHSTLSTHKEYYCSCTENCNMRLICNYQQCRGNKNSVVKKRCTNYVSTIHSPQYLCKECVQGLQK